MVMFIKFRVKAAIANFIIQARADADVLDFLEAGSFDAWMPSIERYGLDANQGAITIITGTVTEIASSNGFPYLMQQAPQVYAGLRKLWFYCENLATANPILYATPFIRDKAVENPFENLPLI